MGPSEQTDAPHGAPLPVPTRAPLSSGHRRREGPGQAEAPPPGRGSQGRSGHRARTEPPRADRGFRTGPCPRLQPPEAADTTHVQGAVSAHEAGHSSTNMQPPMTLPETFTDLGAPEGRREKVRDFRGSSTLCSPHVNYSPH